MLMSIVLDLFGESLEVIVDLLSFLLKMFKGLPFLINTVFLEGTELSL
jgi:hypothetical protein